MAENRKIVRVFLASPGDLGDERAAAKSAVDEFNQTWSAELGYHIELVGWELTVSRFGRPQALINQELDTCELFLGAIWRRWGTPPTTDGSFTSGFEEEFLRSVERRRSTGAPEISLFFKNIDPELLSDPGDDLKRVQRFKKDIIAAKELLFEQFNNVSEFQELVRRSISAHVKSLRRSEAASASADDQVTPDVEEPPAAPLLDGDAGPMSPAAADFVREFVSRACRPYGEVALSAHDVARFRLLANSIHRAGTDDDSLGAHDANQIFAARKMTEYSAQERGALIACGLTHYRGENVPIWYWIASFGGTALLDHTVFGSSQEHRLGALKAIADVAHPLPEDSEARKFYLDSWLEKTTPSPLKEAALSYLAEYGRPSDLAWAKEELSRNDYATTSASLNAIIRIALRESRSAALEAITELSPERIDKSIIQTVFDSTAGISRDQLSAGLDQRNADVRRAVVSALYTRRELDRLTAERLLGDPSRDVRLVAMKYLTENGREFSDDESRALLVTAKLQGLFGSTRPGGADDSALDDFKHWNLTRLPDNILSKRSDIYNRDAEFVLAERRFSKHGASLRAAAGDQYISIFKQELEEMRKRFEGIGELVSKTENLETWLRQKFTRKALDVISRKGKAEDLTLLRQQIESGFVGFSEFDMPFLSKFGEWSDIPNIIKIVEDSNLATTLLPDRKSDAKYGIAARAICTLGKLRSNDLLQIPMSDRLCVSVLLKLSSSSIQSLTDEMFLRLFSRSDADVRKAATLQAVRSIPKNRVISLLDRYVDSEEYRYYNVIRWLDMGASMPRDKAAATATRVILRTWPE